MRRYLTETKKTGDLTPGELDEVVALGMQVFRHGREGFVRNFYFSDTDRENVITYYGDDVIGAHQFYPIEIDDLKVLNLSFAVLDKKYREHGWGKRADDIRLAHGKEYECSFATVRTFSPRRVEQFYNRGFYTPLLSPKDEELTMVGMLIGEHFEEKINENLLIDISKSRVDIFKYTPIQIHAKSSVTNGILKMHLNPDKRARLISRIIQNEI